MVICPLGLRAITRKLKVKWNKNNSGLRKLINLVLKASHMPIENVNVSCFIVYLFIYCFVLRLMSVCLTARGRNRGHEKGKEHRVKCLLHTSLYDDLKWRWPIFCQVWRLSNNIPVNQTIILILICLKPEATKFKKFDVEYVTLRQ